MTAIERICTSDDNTLSIYNPGQYIEYCKDTLSSRALIEITTILPCTVYMVKVIETRLLLLTVTDEFNFVPSLEFSRCCLLCLTTIITMYGDTCTSHKNIYI